MQTKTPGIKVAVLVPYPIFPAATGGQKCIADFYNYLSQNVNVMLLGTTNQPPADYTVPFKGIMPALKYRYINPLLFFKIKKIAKQEAFTHLIVEHPYFGWLAVLLQTYCKLPFLVRSHNIEAIRFKSMHKWWWNILWHYERWVHRKAAASFFITSEDAAFAQTHFNLDHSKCHVITYGTHLQHIPTVEERKMASDAVRQLHQIKASEKILLFNGSLNYQPNIEAVDTIINFINPLLLNTQHFPYKIIICGAGLPAHFNNLEAYQLQHIIYAGFVPDVSIYFKAADIFLNPVIKGGGIKTKLVEAVGYNVGCVSTSSGAFGLDAAVAGKKLKVVADGDWQSFADAILNTEESQNTGPAFFNYFYWGNIAKKAEAVLTNM